MPIAYLDSARVTAMRQTVPPVNYSRTGYGNKLPTSWLVQLDGKRWHRIYVVCWSNSGSAYVRTKDGNLYLGTYDPNDN